MACSAARCWRRWGSPPPLETGQFCALSRLPIVLELGGGPAVSWRRLCGCTLSFEHFRAVKPSLRHAIPGRLARGVTRELRHSLAIGGVPEKFLRWIHQFRPPWWSGCPTHALKAFRVFGEPQPAQGQFTPGLPLLLVDRLLSQSKALARPLPILVLKPWRNLTRAPALCSHPHITRVRWKGSAHWARGRQRHGKFLSGGCMVGVKAAGGRRLHARGSD